jgi:hypothetical protein
LLREQLVAPGRLWLLLKHLDLSGRGWIEIEEARQQLTKKASALRVFGWRQMRKLLARGENLFWVRDGQRLWLRSPLKVAVTLGIKRLNNRPVTLPVTILLQNIGLLRAHFYASFHSGRAQGKKASAKPAPIARATLQALCNTSRRTMRHYEQRAGVQKQRNFAVGKPMAVVDLQDQAWERGRAVLRLKDHAGQVGAKGASYTAWQLPNSYAGPHKQRPKGRQKRINRELADLFMKGMMGNGKQAHQIRPGDGAGRRRFFDDGATATTNYNRCPDQDTYWRNRQRYRPRVVTSGATHCQLWLWLPRQINDRSPAAGGD